MSSDKKKYLPYGRQVITESDINSVIDVLRSPFLTQGPVVPAFEQSVAAKVSAKYGVAVNSATSALHIACLALGLKSGDLLWTSPITFVASANCGRYCGAEVDFVDIEPSTGLISISALRDKLEKAEEIGRLPKILIPVHLTGASCDMEAIGELANHYGFEVIEDASHAIGGRYQEKPVGSCGFSKICVFSFHPVKIITSGEGGLATTNVSELARRMGDLRSHGITKDASRFQQQPAGPWSYEQQMLGFNYRMTDLQAALGLSQLQRLDCIVKERNQQLNRYRGLLASLPVSQLTVPAAVLSSVHLAVIRLIQATDRQHRQVFEGLRADGIGVQLHYSSVHLQPYYRNLGFKEGDFPEAELYSSSAISLPLFPGLSEEDQIRVVNSLECILMQVLD
ncbi:UDP-4-amino-4,6-dideoxy-N-acetyl-beta-L-altrosamine transaminase [bacterium]|nr:UDP-4-amino-4,6-dideoxy-N-acetyl-beta-L-altrosamine transaminase [bacterium]